ncbi:hypothetical protein BJX64DRAFT_263842 [Aspergillus heterothallicus]
MKKLEIDLDVERWRLGMTINERCANDVRLAVKQQDEKRKGKKSIGPSRGSNAGPLAIMLRVNPKRESYH